MEQTTHHHRPLFGVEELAEYLGTSVRHVRLLVAERRVPYFKVGHYVRFRPDDIDAWLDRECRGGPDRRLTVTRHR